jgi:hypothetical protein
MWIARQTGSQLMHSLSGLVYLAVVLRLGFVDLAREFPRTPISADASLIDYLRALGQRLMVFGGPVASLLGARWLLGRPVHDPRTITSENDVAVGVDDPALARLTTWAAGLLGFFFLNFEVHRSMGYFFAPLQLPMLTWLWVVLCFFVILEAVRRNSNGLLLVAGLGVAAILGKILVIDLPSWDITARFLYDGPYSFQSGLMRLIDFGAIIGLLAMARQLLKPRVTMNDAGNFMGLAAIGILFGYVTLEANTLFTQFQPAMRLGGISIVWSLFALGLLLRGILWREKPVRVLGLLLFTVIAFKVFLVDLARLESIYRIVAFIVLGIVILCGSLLYLKFRETFESEPAPAE